MRTCLLAPVVLLLTVTAPLTADDAPARNLLDDFHAADTAGRLAMLPRIAKAYRDDELPGEVRYLLALSLLRPHLSWQAVYAPPKPADPNHDELARIQEKVLETTAREGEEAWRWAAAYGGEEWMLSDVPAEAKDALRKALVESADYEQKLKARGEPAYFWHIKDRDHPDIVRVVRLLEGVTDDDTTRARRWLEEIRRNNTVLTFDVTGGYASGRDAPVVLDARAADKVTFKLYRIRKPEDLLWVEDRIGRDFVYHDHGLQYGEMKAEPLMDAVERVARLVDRRKERDLKAPDFLGQEPASKWDARPGDLKALAVDRGTERGWNRDDEDEEAQYFDDACGQFEDRLNKTYRPNEHEVSSWQCDRVVEVPGKALAEPGAYVLAAEANGETAYAPVLVDPLSLTLRRCRDGVFALVSDPEGKEPAAGARLLGKGMLGEAVADAEGAAFVRLFAAGDRAVIAVKDGRFAVGGFGRVFDGIYLSPLDESFREWHWGRESKQADAKESSARLYADRWVVAALTDRPTYRPGQEVQFKLIVRRLAPPDKADDGRPHVFRAEDFDLAANLRLPEKGAQVPYDLLDPRGRVVATGTLGLNDFGTAAGKAVLNGEAAIGAYALRVKLGAAARIVPEAFAVTYYRAPNFEVEVAGVPEKVHEIGELKLELSGRYYFGKPVAGGKAEVRLVRPEEWKPLAEAEAVLDDAGKATASLTPRKELGGGKYIVVCALTDDSGRTVSRSLPLMVERPEAAAGGLAALPRFAPLGQALEVQTTAAEVVAEQWSRDEQGQADRSSRRYFYLANDDKAVVRPSAPGWYTLTAGKDATELFVYGESGDPLSTWTAEEQQRRDRAGKEDSPRPSPAVPRWVDLSHYRSEEDGSLWAGLLPRPPLLALFDRRQAAVGNKLRVLVYAPGKRTRIVFTMEGATVLDYFVAGPLEEAGDYHVVEIPIQARQLPNFYLQGEIVGGEPPAFFEADHAKAEARLEKKREEEGEDPRWCRVDVIDPNPVAGGEKLQVEVKTDRQEYQPGDTVHVEVRATGLDGKPRVAEAALAAVDEGVFAFGEDRAASLARLFADPHPSQRYARKTWRVGRGNRWVIEGKRLEEWKKHPIGWEEMKEQAAREGESAASARALADLAPALALLGEMPAGALPAGRLRTDFRETAVWLPQLRTGADGVVKASFPLPDSLTRFRLTAVGLTKETEIGVGRASLQTTLPLAVQLFLPRFAVEKDRLSAVGLVHNNGPRDRVCKVSWEVSGAGLDGVDGPVEAWATEVADGKAVGRGRLTVPAGQSVRVGLRLNFDQMGQVKVVFRCEDGASGDAETRTLPVQPLGRQREAVFNGEFKGREKVKLPAGFTARDLSVVVARGGAAQSLEGVGGLVDYPYGCVEQTMSRFLPAVMVQHATRETALRLPPEIADRLPDVLSRGLTRLYHFQHDDGGWGWWEHDATDPRMTAYVVYGLARCRQAGEPVDADVLARGCGWLRQQLAAGGVPEPLAAKAWLALALAGQADAPTLEQWPAEAPDARCLLALACRAAGLRDRGERLWASVRDWRPDDAESLALKLRAALVFGAPRDECQGYATRLMALRTGLGWGSTQATANAIDALAGMTGDAADKPPARNVRVLVGGKAVLDLTDAADLKRAVYRVHLAGDRLPADDGVEIEMRADCDEPVAYTVVASGVQRLDKVEPVGKEIKVSRRLETLDGKPLDGRLRVGQAFAVRLTVDLEKPEEYVLVQDRRPPGCEYADERVARVDPAEPANVEFRDDRVCLFYGALSAGRHEVVYYLRAETPGVSHVLPACAFPMYHDMRRGETGSTTVEVEAAGR